MAQPTGREMLVNLRLKHRQDASPAAMAQLIIAILAGMVWWFTSIYYLMLMPEELVETWHIVVLAVPCAAITLSWHYSTSRLGQYLMGVYTRHILRIFHRHDLAIQLLQPELPERLAAAIGRSVKILRPGSAQQQLLGSRIQQVLAQFPAICRTLGERPFPLYWAFFEGAAMFSIPVLAISLAVIDPLDKDSQSSVAIYAGLAVLLLAAISLKIVLHTARSGALAGAIADSFTTAGEGSLVAAD